MSAQASSFIESLLPHPAQPGSVASGIRVRGHWRDRSALSLCYTTQATDPARILLPAPTVPGPADGLWQHTCFEVFIAAPGADAYLEYNLSPSGQWARYAFSSERVRDPQAEQARGHAPIAIGCETLDDRLILRAELPLADLPPSPQGWMIGLSAIIEDTGGRLGYWALHHPRPAPDFHHPACRLLRLAPPALS